MRYMFIDPSGSFYEGKGHTGIAIIDDWNWETLNVLQEYAKDYDTRNEYWDSVLTWINWYKPDVVIIESFTIRNNGFTTGKMPETIMFIGVLSYHLESCFIKYKFQSPAQAKGRFKDEHLGRYIPNYECRANVYYYLNNKRISDHIRDALKHLLYYKKYGELKNEK